MRSGANRELEFVRESARQICDGCHREFAPSLLTPVGEGYLRVCPNCLPMALATVKTPASDKPAAVSA